jgi:transketolase
MPSWDLFEHYCSEHPGYREEVLPAAVQARVSVEQAASFGWGEYVGPQGRRIGMKTFGASAPLKELQKKFGFTVDEVVKAAKEVLGKA